jgi:ribonuclease Z
MEEPSPIDQTSLAYVVTLRGKPGKLLMDKCMELGVPPGPLLGELKAGRDVVLEGGKTVRSEEVMGEASASQRCLVIECPSEFFLESLVNNPKVCAAVTLS